mmetsp:Transcript_51280/g.116577  ORF Transcript_51280/g.116577 Transcript_51280/m.116577 type:complete len:224 (-) Transcript_51280:225-896(-)
MDSVSSSDIADSTWRSGGGGALSGSDSGSDSCCFSGEASSSPMRDSRGVKLRALRSLVLRPWISLSFSWMSFLARSPRSATSRRSFKTCFSSSEALARLSSRAERDASSDSLRRPASAASLAVASVVWTSAVAAASRRALSARACATSSASPAPRRACSASCLAASSDASASRSCASSHRFSPESTRARWASSAARASAKDKCSSALCCCAAVFFKALWARVR